MLKLHTPTIAAACGFCEQLRYCCCHPFHAHIASESITFFSGSQVVTGSPGWPSIRQASHDGW